MRSDPVQRRLRVHLEHALLKCLHTFDLLFARPAPRVENVPQTDGDDVVVAPGVHRALTILVSLCLVVSLLRHSAQVLSHLIHFVLVQTLVHNQVVLSRPDLLHFLVDLGLDKPDVVPLEAILPVGEDESFCVFELL